MPMRYEIVAREGVIGWSELEFGDPPSGLAYGRFHPSDVYRSASHAGPDAELHARPEGTDEFFRASGGVFIQDLSADHGTEEIKVSVVGLDADTYEQYFSAHLEMYERQFRST
jgi:hypothetical protein